jgi:addiction module killer protein
LNAWEKISELRIDVEPDYRVYFTTVNGEIIFLLAGGDKRTQQADIDTATRLAENLEL